ncbi:DUF2062 domain-containing protein [Paracoccus sp. S-4012]|uniref:DUF2062 domain-containing protein n=1 Tax=Paracoccus sp. S-4012 TaxID=2665648 RepID=UPI001323ADD3|nr:DUF2062 domain-containing protein [Paracoccus sp. S-4012]
MFRRRKPKSYQQIAQDFVYPRGGWARAGRYLLHRLRRLPDPPERIGRGVAAGIYASFTPLFGAHFLAAAALGWAVGGNILAALLGTSLGNPLTFPFIAVISVGLGRWLMGVPGEVSPQAVIGEITHATVELWRSFASLVGPGPAEWAGLGEFWGTIFLPYFLGGALIGLPAAAVGYYLTVPVVRAYQRRRLTRAVARARREAAAREAAAAARGNERH